MGTGGQDSPGGHPFHTVERHEAATDPVDATSVVLHNMDEDAQQASSEDEVDAYAEADASDDSTAQVELVDAECWVQIQLHEEINESAKRYLNHHPQQLLVNQELMDSMILFQLAYPHAFVVPRIVAD